MANEGLCRCGCGSPTPLAPRTTAERGWVRGEPLPFLFRHVFRTRPIDVRANFEKFVSRGADDGACWQWTGGGQSAGYGFFNLPTHQGGGGGLAHRFAYEFYVGPIPKGLELDHLCRNRRCVNPAHLEAVTHRENDLRGAAPALVAHREGRCLRGLHAMTPENARETSNGRRRCRACDTATRRERDRQQREVA